MTIQEFVQKAKINHKVRVEGEVFTIREIVRWKKLRGGGVYYKYTLEDREGDNGYRLAEDPDSGRYILVHLFDFNDPNSFLPEYELQEKKFKFSSGEICVALWQKGGGGHRKGSYDIWWDYEAEDGSYLSLGMALPRNEREDLLGKWVEQDKVELL